MSRLKAGTRVTSRDGSLHGTVAVDQFPGEAIIVRWDTDLDASSDLDAFDVEAVSRRQLRVEG